MGSAPPETAATGNSEAALLVNRVSAFGPLAFAILFAAFFFSSYWLASNLVRTLWWNPADLVSADGVNVGRDFVAFYSAGSLTLDGEAVQAYDHDAVRVAQRQAIGAPETSQPEKFLPWFYPPPMFLFVAPLALMSYLAAYVVWVFVPLVSLGLVVRRYAGSLWASAAILVFPGTGQSVLAGQNGVLSALIIAGGLLNLERRPLLAGAILGLLSYKPHVAAAVYLALLFGSYWRALGAAVAVSLLLAAASLAVFGLEPWLAFLRESHVAKTFIENGQLPWNLMATVFASARLAGLNLQIAYGLQIVVACFALLALFLVWRRGDIPLDARAALLVTVIPLTTPYAYAYDLAVVGIALVWLARSGLEIGLSRLELVVLALAWVTPPVGTALAESTDVLVTPFVLMALLAVLVRRIFSGADRALPGRSAQLANATA